MILTGHYPYFPLNTHSLTTLPLPNWAPRDMATGLQVASPLLSSCPGCSLVPHTGRGGFRLFCSGRAGAGGLGGAGERALWVWAAPPGSPLNPEPRSATDGGCRGERGEGEAGTPLLWEEGSLSWVTHSRGGVGPSATLAGSGRPKEWPLPCAGPTLMTS